MSDRTGTNTLASLDTRSLRATLTFMFFPVGHRRNTAGKSSGLICSKKLSITSGSLRMRLSISTGGIFQALSAASIAICFLVMSSNGRDAIISAHASSISGLLKYSDIAFRNSVLLAKCAECFRTALTAPELRDLRRNTAALMSSA